MEIHVSQGERQMSRDNKTLGKFQLDGIPPAPRGVPQIEVTFDIDANGILHVGAKDRQPARSRRSPSREQRPLQGRNRRCQRDAEAHADEDKKRDEEVETKNEADNLVYQVEKQLEELGDKVPADQRSRSKARSKPSRTPSAATTCDKINSAGSDLEGSAPSRRRSAAQTGPGRRRSSSPSAEAADGEADADEPKQAKGKVIDADEVVGPKQ